MIRLAVSIVTLMACGSPRTSPGAVQNGSGTGSIAVDVDRFPHGVHTGNRPEIRTWNGRGLGCVDCHDAAAVTAGRIARPGVQHHAPCDDCHKAEFSKPPGPLCKVCHVTVDPMRKGASPLQPYPERGAIQTLAASFSHRLHLDAGQMERATGTHVACADCHERSETTRDPMVPGHKVCARCHDQAASVRATLPMARCAGCHPSRDVELQRGRLLITADLRFHHAAHETDVRGAPVACTTCHQGVEDSGSRTTMTVPPMVRCAQCHDDAARSPDRVRMTRCAVCHAKIRSGTPPLNHGVGGNETRPTDHTLVFRKHHSQQAASPDANCRFCHTEVTGAQEDSCFQCHQVMKPRDHNLVFRDDHGRDAQADADRCASCHTPETCVACHSVPPRSHTPLGDFRQGGHAAQARFGLTACLTCHTFEDTCSACHRGAR